MVGRFENDLGDITISNEVIAKAAGLNAIECYGIVGMAAMNVTDGIAKLLKRESLTQGIKVTIDNNQITIDFHVIVEYGINIRAVADNLISTVKYKIETFSGMEVKQLNIFVEGVRVDD